MSDDFYSLAAQRRAQELEAARSQELATLQSARVTSDYEAAATSVATIANIDAEYRNIVELHDQYVRSQQPPTKRELTNEEFLAKPPEAMDWSDSVRIARTSKFGANLDFNDPGMIAGYREALARRGRGE
jgi:hypothetical protein